MTTPPLSPAPRAQPAPSIVGRQAELAAIAARLADPACRLLTLTGPGGIGKSRLALATVERHQNAYPDGAVFIPLQALDSPALIVQAVAEGLCCYLGQTGDPRRELLDKLADQQALLALDNFEHLLDGADLVADILDAAPGLTLLVTSREPLALAEEWVWPVAGLDHPVAPDGAEPPADGAEDDLPAVELFVQRARRARAGFRLEDERAGVYRICALVEGMPLAIELAATWVRALTCDQIAAEIGHGLDILETRMRDIPARHRSMRAVLDQSWARLSPDERAVFARLAIFRGGFTLEAARGVAGATPALLRGLVDKSLVRHAESGRYDLHELVRQYAEECLKASVEQHTEARDRHTAYYMGFLERAWAGLIGPAPRATLDEIEADMDNIRAAWRWGAAMGLTDEIRRGLHSLWFFYDTRGWYREGEAAFALALDVLELDDTRRDEALVRARLLGRQGHLRMSLADFERAKALLRESLARAQQLDSEADIAFAWFGLGSVTALITDDLAEAQTAFERALAISRVRGDRWFEAYALHWLGMIANDLDAQRAAREESAAIFQAIDCQWGMAIAHASASDMLLATHEYDRAITIAQEALALCQAVGIRWGSAMALEAIGEGHYYARRYTAALTPFMESLQIAVESQLRQYIARSSMGIALALAEGGALDRALPFFAVAWRYTLDSSVDNFLTHYIRSRVPEARQAEIEALAAGMDQIGAARSLLAGPDLILALSGAGAESGVPDADRLSERELEILGLVAEGLPNRAIAERLYLSTGTVKWYLNQVYGKLGVGSRTQAVARAREAGLIS